MRLAVLLLAWIALVANAADATFRVYFDIAPASLEELDALLDELGKDLGAFGKPTPLVVVLHGDEANAFVRDNYVANKSVVDRAALLDAHGLIDVKMCATWMRLNDIGDEDIPPFIETVPYGPGEVARLKQDGYEPAPRVRL